MKKEAQTLVEYALIFVLVALMAYTFANGFDFQAIKRYVFMRPVDSTDSSKLKIEAMTEGD